MLIDKALGANCHLAVGAVYCLCSIVCFAIASASARMTLFNLFLQKSQPDPVLLLDTVIASWTFVFAQLGFAGTADDSVAALWAQPDLSFDVFEADQALRIRGVIGVSGFRFGLFI